MNTSRGKEVLKIDCPVYNFDCPYYDDTECTLNEDEIQDCDDYLFYFTDSEQEE